MQNKAPTIARLDTLPMRDLVGRITGEAYSRTADVSGAAGLTRVSIRYEVLAAGRRASALHVHSHTEEFALVLGGLPSLHLGNGQVHALEPGEFVGFPAGPGPTHAFVNSSEQDALLLLVAIESPRDVTTP